MTSGHPVRHILSREDSKISNSGTSYYSAISYQSIKEENVLKHGNSAQLPIILHVQDLSAPYTVSVPSDPKHITAGPRSALRFPVASARPRIYLDLDADCAEAAKWPTSPKAVVPPPDPEIKKIHPLTAYLTQDNKAARWDIRDWISDVAAYQKELRERVRRPRELLQCPEYYMMKNFNRLNVHKPWSPKEERTNKNMAAIMMSTGWAAEPTIHRRIQLAREEEARKVRARVDEAHKAQARAHQAQRAQARTARAAIAAEAAFLERQARKAREVSESPKTDIKPEVRKLANTHKVHFAVCEVPRTAKKAPKTPASALKSIDEGPRTILKVSTVPRTTLEPIDEVPTPTDAISQNERFKIERSAPIGEETPLLLFPLPSSIRIHASSNTNLPNRHTETEQVPRWSKGSLREYA